MDARGAASRQPAGRYRSRGQETRGEDVNERIRCADLEKETA